MRSKWVLAKRCRIGAISHRAVGKESVIRSEKLYLDPSFWGWVVQKGVMGREISEDVLRGIAEALRLHAPHLLPTIHKLIRRGLADGPEGKIGTSVYGKLTTTISWEEGEPILRALESIESKLGFNAQFADRQINWLIICWRQFAEPLQLKSSG